MEEANVQGTPKKGLSKGCVIALVVTLGVVIILTALGFFFCDSLIRLGMTAPISQIQKTVTDGDIEGVDKEAFNKVVNGFNERFSKDKGFDRERLQGIATAMQAAAAGKDQPSAESINDLMKAMADYYPELKQYLPAETAPMEDSSMEEPADTTDTTGTE